MKSYRNLDWYGIVVDRDLVRLTLVMSKTVRGTLSMAASLTRYELYEGGADIANSPPPHETELHYARIGYTRLLV